MVLNLNIRKITLESDEWEGERERERETETSHETSRGETEE